MTYVDLLDDLNTDTVELELTLRFTYRVHSRQYPNPEPHQIATHDRELYCDDADQLLQLVQTYVDSEDYQVKVCPAVEAD